MAEFLPAYRHLAAAEGGYVNHPKDRGKETYKGITRVFNPAWQGWLIIDKLRKEPGFPRNLSNHPELEKMVQDFYRSQFWNKIYGDKIEVQEVATEVMDTAVNMGVGIAVGFVQNAINFLNRNASLYPDIEVDQAMGPNTLRFLNNCEETDVLLKLLNGLQFARYINIIQRDPTQEEFLRGWLKRT